MPLSEPMGIVIVVVAVVVLACCWFVIGRCPNCHKRGAMKSTGRLFTPRNFRRVVTEFQCKFCGWRTQVDTRKGHAFVPDWTNVHKGGPP